MVVLRSYRTLVLAFVIGCGAPVTVPPPSEAGHTAPPAPLPATPPATTAAPPGVADGGAPVVPRGPTVSIRARSDRPVTCNAGQTNTPCLYKAGAGCRLRRKNCTNLPCTEAAHEPVECGRAVGAMGGTARVCLEVRPLPHDATLACSRNDSTSEIIAGPLGDAEVARVCGSADRTWSVAVSSGGSTFEAEVDWRRASCFVVDLAAGRVAGPCAEPSTAKSYENRL